MTALAPAMFPDRFRALRHRNFRLFFIGLPVLAAGTLLGWSLYGKLHEVAFRKVVLALLLVSGLAIVATSR